MTIMIIKPSFWKTDRELRDDSRMLVGRFRFSNSWQTKAEGDVEGRKISFSYPGWDSRYTEMSETGGKILARIEPVGWWGTWYKLTYKDKEYRWGMNGWGTTFSVYDGETEILRVNPGGYFKPGKAEVLRPMDNSDLVPMVMYGIYQFAIIASQASAGAGAATSGAIVASS